jgi:hypothetical protein
MWQPPPALLALCRTHLGQEPTEVVRFHRANGSLHSSIRLWVGDDTFIATHRSDPRRGGMEAVVLAAMYLGGAPVPRPIAYGEGWLLQEDLGTTTLARTLNEPGAPLGELVGTALGSLEQVHEVGRHSEVAPRIPQTGHGRSWAAKRLRVFSRVAETVGIPFPGTAAFEEAFLELMSIPGPSLIKRDTRPTNASVDPEGQVRWFDWEHTCRRWIADDLIWLLCDETLPDLELGRRVLLEQVARPRPEAPCPQPVSAYLSVAVQHHIAWRVGLHLQDLRDGGDRSLADCIANDWTGSTDAVRHLCAAGAEWAAIEPHTAPLADWYRSIAESALPVGPTK